MTSSNIPAVRFTDDHGNTFPEWKETQLGAVSQNVMYGMNAAATTYDGNTQYIRITDIDEGSNRFRPDPITSPNEPAKDRYLLRRGDIVFARTGASVGKSYLYDEADGKLAFAGFLIRFSILESVASPYFVFLQTLTGNYWSWVKVNSMRSGQPGINAEEYKTLTFLLPTLPEQQRIVDFLMAVDGRIQQLIQKKTLLEDYKKGVMEQLFTQTVRFKDDHGNDFSDWEEKKLGEVCELVNGLTYSPDDVAETGLLVLRSSNVQNGQVVFDDNVFVTTKVKEWNLTRPGDILICARNGSKRLIGKNAIIPDDCPPSTHGAFMTVLRGDQNKFVFQLLQTDVYKRNVHINLGATINSINGSDLKKFKFMFPSPDEQARIANFLSAIDRKIESVTTQVTETLTFKTGLLQQMFV